jgi:hypothetical protein
MLRPAPGGAHRALFDDAPIARLPMPERKPGLDALIDVLAPIAVDAPVSGEAALAALPPTRRAGSKPFAIEGRNDATQRMGDARAGQRYGAFQAGVQLANRTGALNEIEYSEFVMKAQAFADAINGAPEFPEMRDEVARARELDQFAGATTPSSASRCAPAMRPGARATCSRTRPGWASWPASSPAAWCCPPHAGQPPMLGWRSTPRPRCPKTRRSRRSAR